VWRIRNRPDFSQLFTLLRINRVPWGPSRAKSGANPVSVYVVALLLEEQLGSGGKREPSMAKVDRHGAAATISADEMEALLEGAPSPRYRCLWAIQRWTAGRIGEVLALRWGDLNGVVTYRKGNTKTKTTRQVPTAPRLEAELAAYRIAWAVEHGHAPAKDEALFPSAGSTHTPQSRQAADKALRQTCEKIGLQGVSTHSFRRTLATDAVRRGVPLNVVQQITGHKSLGSLGHYLEADETEILAAIIGD
jgi:integrase/recombinase XerD